MTCLAGSMSRNEAILLVILAVDLRVPAVLGDDQIKPVLQKFFRREREVELDGKRKSSASTHWNRGRSRSKNQQPRKKPRKLTFAQKCVPFTSFHSLYDQWFKTRLVPFSQDFLIVSLVTFQLSPKR